MQMAGEEEESYVHGVPVSWPIVPPPAASKLCHSCNSATAMLFCRHHSAFFCLNCDAKIHLFTSASHHRVPVCDVCEGALNLNQNSKLALCPSELKSEDVIFPDVDPLDDFDLPDPVSYGDFKQETISYSDSVVRTDHCYISSGSPIADFEALDASFNVPKLLLMHVQPPAKSTHSPIHQTVVSDHSSLTTSIGGGGDFAKNDPVAATRQISATERDARVLRYKEKRKNRKFEKTIRYGSRKAYAETRPRIKGRFAKRGDSNVFSDHLTFESDPFSYMYG